MSAKDKYFEYAKYVIEERLGDSPTKSYPQLNASLLYFKLLLSNDLYKLFCDAMRDSDADAVELVVDKFPNVLLIWDFWGDIFRLGDELDEKTLFNSWYWKDKNYFKFLPVYIDNIEVVNEGDPIIPVTGTTYITITKAHDLDTVNRLYHKKFLKLLPQMQARIGEFIVNLNNQNDFSSTQAIKYERAVDVTFWTKHLDLSNKECILQAYSSESQAWDKLKYNVNTCLKICSKSNVEDLTMDELKSVTKLIDRSKDTGKEISLNILNMDFSFPDNVDFI